MREIDTKLPMAPMAPKKLWHPSATPIHHVWLHSFLVLYLNNSEKA